MLRKLLIIWGIIVLAVVGMAWAGGPTGTPASTVLRVTDGIGWQYKCVSNSLKNQYGFGGAGDTLATDSTVSRGTIMNIHRIKEATDQDLSELLPIFMSARTQLDSQYIYNKWSSVIWGLNNFYSSVGGLSGWQQARADSGRFSPYFARVARANNIFLAAKTVYPPALNFGSGTIAAGVITYSDSNAIDSTLYGPTPGSAAAYKGQPYYSASSITGTGTCTLKVFGSNQNLVHGRIWLKRVDETITVGQLPPAVTGDSCYNIDSSKIVKLTDGFSGNIIFKSLDERTDSL